MDRIAIGQYDGEADLSGSVDLSTEAYTLRYFKHPFIHSFGGIFLQFYPALPGTDSNGRPHGCAAAAAAATARGSVAGEA